jgi:hypothetical protein
MALKGTLDHPKLINLADALDIDPCFALGILEAMWHFTDKYATEGDIGRFTNRAIALGLKTTIKPDRLIDALVKSGFLDEDEDHRLIVHDWHVHSSDSTKAKAKARGRGFVSGSDPRRNTNGRPKELQTETANETSSTANVSANGPPGSSSKLSVNGSPSAVSDNCKIPPRARSGNREPGTGDRRPRETPNPFVQIGREYGSDFVLPWGAGPPKQVARLKLLRMDTENCDADIKDLDTGDRWTNFGDTWKQLEVTPQHSEGQTG